MRGGAALSDSLLLPALDKKEDEGGGVNWKSVTKLMNFIQNSECITDDLRYSLKARMKCKDHQIVLNTLTVFYTIALNGGERVRNQLADKTYFQKFGKTFSKHRNRIVRCAVLQLLVDWSFLFSDSPLGKNSAELMRELAVKEGLTVRPSSVAAILYEEQRRDARTPHFRKGFEFEYRDSQFITHEEKHTKKISMSCASNLTSGTLKLGSVRKLFTRGSTKSLKRHADSTIIRELSAKEHPNAFCSDTLLEDVPRDCKKLQDLLSDMRVLMDRGHFDDAQAKITVAEQLRNKCAVMNNTLQEMITTKMKRVTLEDGSKGSQEIKPEMLTGLIKAGEVLKLALDEFEQTHQAYIRHLDRITALNGRNLEERSFSNLQSSSSESAALDSGDGTTKWVSFASQGSIASPFLRTASTCIPASAKPPPYRRPHSSNATRITSAKIPVSTSFEDESCLPQQPIQSPFADASALLRATHARETPEGKDPLPSVRSSEERPGRLEKAFTERSNTFSFLPVESSSRSFTEIKRGGHHRISNCPALKVRFTDEHLEDVLSRLGKLD